MVRCGMENPELEPGAEPANLRLLRRLVTGLTVVMVAGVLTIVVLLVMRFRATPPLLPPEITLPDGASVTAFTQGDTWFAVVTDSNRILVFDRVTGALRQTVTIDP